MVKFQDFRYFKTIYPQNQVNACFLAILADIPEFFPVLQNKFPVILWELD